VTWLGSREVGISCPRSVTSASMPPTVCPMPRKPQLARDDDPTVPQVAARGAVLSPCGSGQAVTVSKGPSRPSRTWTSKGRRNASDQEEPRSHGGLQCGQGRGRTADLPIFSRLRSVRRRPSPFLSWDNVVRRYVSVRLSIDELLSAVLSQFSPGSATRRRPAAHRHRA